MEIHGKTSHRPDIDLSQSGSRNKIVLELSARVSEQDEIIQNLERELAETKKKFSHIPVPPKKKEDRKISSSKGPIRPKHMSNSPRSGSDSNLRNVASEDDDPGTSRSGIKDIEFNEETHWCAKVEETPRNSAVKDPIKKFSTWTGDNDDNTELKQIAREMKKLQTQKRRKQKQSEVDPMRKSSALSRDSGVNVDIENLTGDHTVKNQKDSVDVTLVQRLSPKQPDLRLELPSRLSSYGSETSLNNLLPSDNCDISDKKTSKQTEVRCIDDALSKSNLSNHHQDILVESMSIETQGSTRQYDPSCLPVV